MKQTGDRVKVEPVDATKFPEFDYHKKIVSIHDAKTGLRGFIAIHNTNLGSAIGGTRRRTIASKRSRSTRIHPNNSRAE